MNINDMKATVRTIYEVGKRSNQEDSVYPMLKDGVTEQKFFILADGMGGHVNGQLASSTVCRTMGNILNEIASQRDIQEDDFLIALDAAYKALDAIDDEESDKKMGTTLTFVSFGKEGALAAHIGDSRIYHIRPTAESPILYKSMDHSLVNDLFRIGEITEEEMATSKSRHILTRAVQPHQEYRAEADIEHLTDVKPGDYFYMCSDGMLENISDVELLEIICSNISDDEKKGLLLANSQDNKDNHSAFLIRVGGDDKATKNVPDVTKKNAQKGIEVYNSHVPKGLAFKYIAIVLFVLAIALLVYWLWPEAEPEKELPWWIME